MGKSTISTGPFSIANCNKLPEAKYDTLAHNTFLHHSWKNTLLSRTSPSHTVLGHTLREPHTTLSPRELSCTTLSHTPLLHTPPLHGTLSHTSLRHVFLAHTDPPPSLFSFLPFPSQFHLSLATYWKLTCGVIRSNEWWIIHIYVSFKVFFASHIVSQDTSPFSGLCHGAIVHPFCLWVKTLVPHGTPGTLN